MFYYIEGKVAIIEPNLTVIDCAGVGYAINTTSTTLSHLAMGEKARLFTYCNIREDCFDIYGFYSTDEKRMFEMLLGVSGVGPKAALSMLSATTPESLAMAIVSGNDKALTIAPGIGKKIAQRVILELKDKVAKENEYVVFSSQAAVGAGAAAGGSKLSDAAAALAVLGYGGGEISSALREIDTEALTLEEIVRQALRKMLK